MDEAVDLKPGRFVTFEGGEGAGKSTQVARLRDRLAGMGLAVLTTREPGGSEKAEALRLALLAGRSREFGPLAEAVLFAAARADHVRRTVRPALARGEWVLCDRFSDSTRVYQGVLGAVAARKLAALERVATGGLAPDVTVVLDVPTKDGLSRVEARRQEGATADRFEGEGAGYHARVREAFAVLAAGEPRRCVLVNGSGSPSEVAEAIWAALQARVPGLSPHGA